VSVTHCTHTLLSIGNRGNLCQVFYGLKLSFFFFFFLLRGFPPQPPCRGDDPQSFYFCSEGAAPPQPPLKGGIYLSKSTISPLGPCPKPPSCPHSHEDASFFAICIFVNNFLLFIFSIYILYKQNKHQIQKSHFPMLTHWSIPDYHKISLFHYEQYY